MNIPQEFVVVDIETTGLKPAGAEIIEVAAVKVKNGEIVDVFQALIRPEYGIPAFITNFTGITEEMVESAPHIAEILLPFCEFIDQLPIVGHNVQFDLNFLNHNTKQYFGHVIKNPSIDTLALARKSVKDTKNHKLETLAHYFGIDASNNHRALKDVYMTLDLYEKLTL